MNKTRLVALAAALFASVALPASAQPAYGQYDRTVPNSQYDRTVPNSQYDRTAPYSQFDRSGLWNRIGSVDFSFRPDRETAYGNFGGRVEKLAFTARTGSVRCSRITATFNNGRTRELYRGVLQRGREVVVDLPGQSRLIRRIDFNCRSVAPRVARVDIAADIGQYRADWRRSPDWDRVWSRMFNWNDDQFAGGGYYGDRVGGPNSDRSLSGPPLNTAGWITLGTEVFEGPNDRETTVAGFGGRNVDRIAIRPINGDARCSRITATFANGMTRNLGIDDRQVLQEDRVHQLDLPGGNRNVERIDMMCHAENGRQVTMLVMANQ